MPTHFWSGLPAIKFRSNRLGATGKECLLLVAAFFLAAFANPKSCATLGMPSRSVRSKVCSLNYAVYLLRTVRAVIPSFLVSIVDLGDKRLLS
jgi:hypothetical protein